MTHIVCEERSHSRHCEAVGRGNPQINTAWFARWIASRGAVIASRIAMWQSTTTVIARP